MYTGHGLRDLGLTPDCLSLQEYEWILAKLPVVHIVTLPGGVEMHLVTSCHK